MINYIILSILAVVLGQITAHLNKKLPPIVKEEIGYNEFFKTVFKGYRVDIKYTVIMLLIINFLNYYIGYSYKMYLLSFVIMSLLIVFSVDYRFQLIPDTCHYIIVIVSVINILFNINIWYNYILGAIIGGLIFYLLGLLAIAIFKKEGMGFGDVKLMASLGLFFGIKDICIIALLSFFISAVVGITLIILKKKEMDSYIPFGPFIVISTLVIIYTGSQPIIYAYISLCTYLSRIITDIVYKLR